MESVTITQAKNNLTQLVHKVEDSHGVIELTRHGKASAVLLSYEDYKKLSEARPSFVGMVAELNVEFKDVKIEDDVFEGVRSKDSGREVHF